ncbi:hypothetical protein RJ641_001506 [Dillenia turbinata]|uniref:Uncharacterized protein n=1 Tax=Dillenia turbinata TaxID=194707 RepID=A0AAN8ZV61_9MAGN
MARMPCSAVLSVFHLNSCYYKYNHRDQCGRGPASSRGVSSLPFGNAVSRGEIKCSTNFSIFFYRRKRNNIHSVLNKGRKWTDSYWDEFASLPAIVPKGPIAIFGLGGGTAANLMLDLWPSLQLEGWEIDEILIDKAREHLGLYKIEQRNQAGGFLTVRVGDALHPSANVPGGYAGIIVDLFSDGKVLPQLQKAATWLDLHDRLMPHGRIMVNCGGSSDSAHCAANGNMPPTDGAWVQNSTIKALCKAFPGQLCWKRIPGGENYLAVTGPTPDLTLWSASVPFELRSSVKQWRSCKPGEWWRRMHLPSI